MKSANGMSGARLAATMLSIVAVAGLCFSAGEGLRLTPFPHAPAHARAEAHDPGVGVAGLSDGALKRYGPLDKPSQAHARKSGKRLVPDCDCPPPHDAREQSTDLLQSSCADAHELFTSAPSGPGHSGRAPPRLV